MAPAPTNTPTKPTAAPERSLLQRLDALKRANDIRTRRAQLKRDLKGGRISIHQLLLNPPAYVETAKVFLKLRGPKKRLIFSEEKRRDSLVQPISRGEDQTER